MRTPAALVAASVVASGLVLASPSVVAAGPGASSSDPAVVRRVPAPSASPSEVIPGRYVVVLKAGRSTRLRSVAARASSYGGTVTRRFSEALDGFAAAGLTPRAARALAEDPAVAFVEPDQRVRATSVTQPSAPWALDRIDQRARSLDKRYTYDRTGLGVTAYVIDSGIRRTHKQLGGRVLAGFTSIKDGRGTKDCFGHGTHVAGSIGSKKFGVAKRVTLRPVRVLGCRGGGSVSGIIAGVDWVTAHHKGKKPAVANMSLGGDYSAAMNQAVRRSVLDGVTYVLAAGNEAIDACRLSPASTGSAITVGATNPRDGRASFSDFGVCVDLFAPGTGIRSLGIRNDTATAVHDGTSMAAPHVAGAAALYLQSHPTASPAQVNDAVLAAATTGVVTGRGPASPNRLLYSRVDRVAPAPVRPPTGNVVRNPSFEAGRSPWSTTQDVVGDDAHGLARTGSWYAWLNGRDRANVDTLSQSVTVPVGPSPRLTFWLLIATGEDDDGVYDTLTLSAGSTELQSWSNLDATGTYRKQTVDLSAYAGQTVTIRFRGVEDSGIPTSFLLDDLYVTGS